MLSSVNLSIISCITDDETSAVANYKKYVTDFQQDEDRLCQLPVVSQRMLLSIVVTTELSR